VTSNKRMEQTKRCCGRDWRRSFAAHPRCSASVWGAMKPTTLPALRSLILASAIVLGCGSEPHRPHADGSVRQEFVSGWKVPDAARLRQAAVRQLVDDMQAQGEKFWRPAISYRVCDAGVSNAAEPECYDMPDGLSIEPSGVESGVQSGRGSARSVTVGAFWRCPPDSGIHVPVTAYFFESAFQAEYLGVLEGAAWRARFVSGTYLDGPGASSQETRGCRTRS
jgi:hypothetical protein